MIIFFFKQKTAYDMRISDWSSDVCSSDLWSDMKLRERHTAGSTLSRTAGARFDPRHGNARLTLNYYEKYIATPSIDIERRSAYSLRYDGASAEWMGMDASQSLRILQVRRRNSVFAGASTAAGLGAMTLHSGFEERLGR